MRADSSKPTLYVIHVEHLKTRLRLRFRRRELSSLLRFERSRAARLDLAPTLGACASKSATSTLPRFAKDHSVFAGPASGPQDYLLPRDDAQCDDRVCQKPSFGSYT